MSNEEKTKKPEQWAEEVDNLKAELAAKDKTIKELNAFNQQLASIVNAVRLVIR